MKDETVAEIDGHTSPSRNPSCIRISKHWPVGSRTGAVFRRSSLANVGGTALSLGGLRVPDRNHYIRQVHNTTAGRHICILIRDLADAAGNRAPPVGIDAVVFHRVAPFLSGRPQHGNRQDRAEKPGSHTAYTESRSGLAVDFPARPVRVPWLLRATGKRGEEGQREYQVATGPKPLNGKDESRG